MIRNKKEMPVKPPETTRLHQSYWYHLIPCHHQSQIHHYCHLLLFYPHPALTACHHLLLNHFFHIQSNSKGLCRLFSFALAHFVPTFAFFTAAASQLFKNFGCWFLIHPMDFDALICYYPSVTDVIVNSSIPSSGNLPKQYASSRHLGMVEVCVSLVLLSSFIAPRILLRWLKRKSYYHRFWR